MSSEEQFDNIPWDAIAASFEGALQEEEERELELWLMAAPANRERYEQLQNMWREGLRDYEYFRRIDRKAGWEELRQRMNSGAGSAEAWESRPDGGGMTAGTGVSAGGDGMSTAGEERMAAGEGDVNGGDGGTTVGEGMITAGEQRAMTVRMRKWVTRGMLAAVVIAAMIFGAQRWMAARGSDTVYENTTGNVMKVRLADGTVAVLQPGTRLRTDKEYGGRHRIVQMDSGVVSFDVVHNGRIPFEVYAGNLNIRDIGTQFRIKQTSDSVLVSVFTGKVACMKRQTGEVRVLGVGMAIGYGKESGKFAQAVLTGVGADSSRNLLRFEDTPLSDVVHILEQTTGRDIRLQDAALGRLKLTARLDGETYEDAIKIICTSLNLQYTESGNEGILRQVAGR